MIYTLKNGRKLEVIEHEGQGMAGEPMTYLLFINHAKDIVSFKSIYHLLNDIDCRDIEYWIGSLENDNYYSAINYVI